MKARRFAFVLIAATCLVGTGLSIPSALAQEAASIAVFGDNAIDDFLDSAGFEATVVTDEQLSTDGFLASFDAFFYTRNGAETPGPSLSELAAANVQEYVRSAGRGVLLNGDFADTIDATLNETPDPEIQQLISNATSWSAQTHHGFIGEYTGAVAGLTSNSDAITPLSFVSGSAGPLTGDFPEPGDGPAQGEIVKTPAGEGSPILEGVAFPLTDPNDELMFGSIVTGVDSSVVLARYFNPGKANDGNPAVISFSFGGTRDAATAFCPDEGCTVTTNTGDGATRDDNTFSTVIVPEGADAQTVTITEAAASTQPTFCGGSRCNGQIVTISDVTGVDETDPEPIKVEMTFDKTVKGGTQIYIQKPDVPGFLTPQLVPNCTTPGVASPHPCVSSKIVLANGDRLITVLLLSGDPILGKK
jgi:hypothetical protein